MSGPSPQLADEIGDPQIDEAADKLFDETGAPGMSATQTALVQDALNAVKAAANACDAAALALQVALSATPTPTPTPVPALTEKRPMGSTPIGTDPI